MPLLQVVLPIVDAGLSLSALTLVNSSVLSRSLFQKSNRIPIGEFGTGKTWLTLHYAWTALQRYRDAKERKSERPRIPLVIPLRDYAKAVSVESLFSEFFFRKYEIPILGYSVFEQLNRMGKLLLIFDGFDEMADRVDNQKMINNFWELARVVVPGSKAILTCRTEHFPEAKDGRALLNAELEASTSALTGEPPQFEVLELEKFNDDQIRQVLSFRAGVSTVEQIMENPQLLDLARRPVMTELILEALPDIEAGNPVDMSRIYLYAVRNKMERDIKAERTFTSLADKLYFLCELSWEMLSTDQMSLNYRLFPDRIRRLFGHAVQEEKYLDHWHFDMMGQTMLIRNADGDYSPAHRSLLEFFVAYKFAAELGVIAPDFADLAKAQSHLNESVSSDYTWSSYFNRECDENGNIKPILCLQEFIPEEIELLAETVGKETLNTDFFSNNHDKLVNIRRNNAIFELIGNMISSDNEKVKARLLTIITETCGKTSQEVGIVGGNVASLLVQYDPISLRGKNLAGANLRYANFSEADLTECNLDNTDLSNARFDSQSIMLDATLRNSNLNNLRLGDLLIGWISKIPLNKTPSLLTTRNPDTPAIFFYYPHGVNHSDRPNLPFKVKQNEIVVAYGENRLLKWNYRIKSVYILNEEVHQEVLKILTVEGEDVYLELKTGLNLPVDEATSFLRSWRCADFTGVIGLGEREIYILKILGAISLPNTSYNPRNDSKLNFGLRHNKGEYDFDELL
ncbi:hypothetical protein CDG76_07010 [Nostoc sp. 'Peltigera membranacea cyanobiont' 210A]|nr:hypothetical protein CDG76_07010 [Nostoc sp. 'Peltigera membranacea cyanobiont' 210A]